MSNWSGKKVVVVGAARQGLALARYLLQHGAQVVLNDQRAFEELAAAISGLKDLPEARANLEWICGGHPLSLLEGIDLLCLSGGVPLSLPIVKEAQSRGIPLSNDSQVLLEVIPCKAIGITGSAGKTTTTTLVGRMALAETAKTESAWNGKRVWVGGNIGLPLISFVDEMSENDLAVLELSSFQLELMTKSPEIAAVLNITPNHLDRHETMEVYSAAKAEIINNQNAADTAILGRDDPGAWALKSQLHGNLLSFGFSDLPLEQEGAYIKENVIFLRQKHSETDRTVFVDVPVVNREAITLRGDHNLLNVMAAVAISAAAGISIDAMKDGIIGFTGVRHRLEYVRSWGGAAWYNDSIATAPERTIAAIRSFEEPLVLLAGGRDKNLDWDSFARLVHQRVKHLILFGEAAEKIYQAVKAVGKGELHIIRCQSLKEAVSAAATVVEIDDVVLLSPGGTSFDEFHDFEERGECFAKWVTELP